jgi:hypothetical protein
MDAGTRHEHEPGAVSVGGFASVPWPVAVSATLHCFDRVRDR